VVQHSNQDGDGTPATLVTLSGHPYLYFRGVVVTTIDQIAGSFSKSFDDIIPLEEGDDGALSK
jgi:hypothetical protein